MKNKHLNELINIELTRAERLKASNGLDSDARAMIEDTIKTLTDLRERAEAEPDELGVDTMVNQIRDIIDEKINAAMEKVKDIPTPAQNSDYLNSRQAVRDFATCLRSTNGAQQFRTKWADTLKKNGITFDTSPEASEGFLPALVKGRIDDLWNSDTNWLRRLNNTGAKRYAIRYTSETQDVIEVRARGHNPYSDTAGEEIDPAEKKQQDVDLTFSKIEVGAIYKLQSLDNLTIFNDDGALIEWIADELVRQVYYTIGRAVLIGNNDMGSVYNTPSFQSIVATAYTTGPLVYDNTSSSSDLIENVMDLLIQPIYDGRDIALFMTPADLFELRKYVYATGGTTRYASIDEVKGMLGVSDIITVPYLNNQVGGEVRMIAAHLDRYYTVGKMQNFEFLRFPDHIYNKEYFRVETFAGGAPGLNCASILRNA